MHIIKYLFPTLPSGTYGERFTFWGRPCVLTRSPGPGRTGHPAAWPSPGFGVALVAACYANAGRSAGSRRCNGPFGVNAASGPAAFLSRTERMCGRFGPAMAGPLLQPPAWIPPPPPGAWINQGTAWGWGGLRPPSLLAKTKDSVAGFCCAEKQTKKVGPGTVRPGSPPHITAAAKK